MLQATTKKIGLKPAKVLNVQSSSLNKQIASIIVEVFDIGQNKNVILIISGCEILPNGRYRKDVSKRNIGLQYLYF